MFRAYLLVPKKKGRDVKFNKDAQNKRPKNVHRPLTVAEAIEHLPDYEEMSAHNKLVCPRTIDLLQAAIKESDLAIDGFTRRVLGLIALQENLRKR